MNIIKAMANLSFLTLLGVVGCNVSPVSTDIKNIETEPIKTGLVTYQPRLAINGSEATPIVSRVEFLDCNDWNSSKLSYAPQYFVSVMQSDQWWNSTGPENGHWLVKESFDNCDLNGSGYLLNNFCYAYEYTIIPGNYYRVKIATNVGGWRESVKLVYVIPSKIIINGSTSSPKVIERNEQILVGDANNAIDDSWSDWEKVKPGKSQHPQRYFISVQVSDASWNRYGREATEWLGTRGTTVTDDMKIFKDAFDLRVFCNRKFLFLQPGNYYRVKLAIAGMGPSGWYEQTQLIYLK